MSRQFTKGPQSAGDIILVQPQNEEINQAAAELNGGLDQNNMPLNSLLRIKCTPPVVTTVASPQQTSIKYASQAYYFTEESTNVTQIPYTQWTLGWNKFEVLASAADINGWFLDFESVEGMLKGESCIDLEFRQSFRARENGAGAEAYRIPDKHRGELAVFVNDVLVGRTGPLWFSCGRNSYVLPFGCAIGSGPCHVDVRWSVEFQNEYRAFGAGYTINVIDQIANLKLNDRLLWVRNEYR